MAQSHLIIGAGNMGGALLSGWLDASVVNPRNIAILDPTPGVEAVYAIERGAKHVSDTSKISRTVKTVLLSVKPQMFSEINSDIADTLADGTLVISIMAGISMSALRDAFPNCIVVRAMPNTPAAVGQGITAYLTDGALDPDTIERVETLLGASGTVVRIDTDEQINAVTAISGSGPAYLFHFCETLTSAAQSLGLDPEVSAQLARETVIGAAELMRRSDRSPAELREAVTSPGGTTQAALDTLMGPDGMMELMRSAVRAAMTRARDLSE